MNLNKCYDFFQPEKVRERIHIIGCGSVGSTIAENLVRCGLTNISLWDFDTVEDKNIANQMYGDSDIGKNKAVALKSILAKINPEAESLIEVHEDGWNGKTLSGYVFMAVDSMEVRRKIVNKHLNNEYVKAVFDFRTLLESAQSYAADWGDFEQKQNLLNSMQFSDDEAYEETPTSACGETLGVVTTVRLICALGVNNFINFVKDKKIKKFIVIDGFIMDLVSF